ncbi:MAG: response regulator [Desulfosalsimonas sp.]
MNRAEGNVLIIDDEESVRFTLSRYLRGAGYTPYCAAGIMDASSLIESEDFEAAVVDRILANGENGLDAAEKLCRRQPSCTVVIISAYPDFESAARAISLKVFAYLKKPVRRDQIISVIKQAAGLSNHAGHNKRGF